MPNIGDDGKIGDDEFAAILSIRPSQEAIRRDLDAALREFAGCPCPVCGQIDTPLPGAPPLRLIIRTRHSRTYWGCARRHEFERAEQIRLAN